MSDRPALSFATHWCRCLMVFALAAALRYNAHDTLPAPQDGTVVLAEIQSILPAVERIEGEPPWWNLVDGSGQSVGLAAHTSPEGNRAIGYRGPSNVLLVTDSHGVVIGSRLVTSRDTPEHVRAVENDGEFWAGIRGAKQGEPLPQVDGVSGATLTSLAILESISLRLSGHRVSLKFPRAVGVDEVTEWYPEVVQLIESEWCPGRYQAIDERGQAVAIVARTGSLVDDEIGYQGPSELLVGFDVDERLEHLALRYSYDNQPYVRYVEEEDYFWGLFVGKSLPELASWDLEVESVEGVSGATMTSIAVAWTLQRWAQECVQLQQARTSAESASESVAGLGKWHDWITLLIVVGAGIIGGTHLRGAKKLQWVWRGVLVVVLGFWLGSLVSQTMIWGWAESGIAWRLAPGLTALLGVALMAPPLTKRNIYCHQLCPHGALQWMVKRRHRWTLRPGRRLTAVLATIPWVLLVAAYLCVLLRSSISTSHLEPFDAYLWPVAATGSIVLAIASLVLAAFIPMAYCRFGCPTGRLLEYVRRHARSGTWVWGDTWVLAMVVVAWAYVLLRAS